MVTAEPHPLLSLSLLSVSLPEPLQELSSPPELTAGLDLSAPSPLAADPDVKPMIRKLLRWGGYRPSGRGKPASEYLVQAAEREELKSINPLVDVCNLCSLHSGLPISVVDLDRCASPLRVGIAEEDARYVFNLAGHEIRLRGLLCLHDADGPCANAVKDSQRTKTHPQTQRALYIIWAHRELEERAQATRAWAERWLRDLGMTLEYAS